jgi:hypothetical protein
MGFRLMIVTRAGGVVLTGEIEQTARKNPLQLYSNGALRAQLRSFYFTALSRAPDDTRAAKMGTRATVRRHATSAGMQLRARGNR